MPLKRKRVIPAKPSTRPRKTCTRLFPSRPLTQGEKSASLLHVRLFPTDYKLLKAAAEREHLDVSTFTKLAIQNFFEQNG